MKNVLLIEVITISKQIVAKTLDWGGLNHGHKNKEKINRAHTVASVLCS